MKPPSEHCLTAKPELIDQFVELGSQSTLSHDEQSKIGVCRDGVGEGAEQQFVILLRGEATNSH